MTFVWSGCSQTNRMTSWPWPTLALKTSPSPSSNVPASNLSGLLNRWNITSSADAMQWYKIWNYHWPTDPLTHCWEMLSISHLKNIGLGGRLMIFKVILIKRHNCLCWWWSWRRLTSGFGALHWLEAFERPRRGNQTLPMIQKGKKECAKLKW